MSLFENRNDRNVLFEKSGHFSNWMKLIYLGKKINTGNEQNIECENEFGFNVTIVYLEHSSYFQSSKKKAKIYNCTQVHYGYTDMGLVEPLTKIAFESDIHSTGFNRKIEEIESVEITLSTKKYVDYHIVYI